MGLRAPRFGWLLAIAAAVAALDQAVKWFIAARLHELDRVAVLPFFDLVRWHNTGAAFGLLSNAPGWQNGFFLLLGLGLLAFLVVLMRRSAAEGDALWPVGLSLMAGGAIGNLIDRATRGYVLDFVSLHYQNWHFPAFNVADSAITAGVILALVKVLFLNRPGSAS